MDWIHGLILLATVFASVAILVTFMEVCTKLRYGMHFILALMAILIFLFGAYS